MGRRDAKQLLWREIEVAYQKKEIHIAQYTSLYKMMFRSEDKKYEAWEIHQKFCMYREYTMEHERMFKRMFANQHRNKPPQKEEEQKEDDNEEQEDVLRD